CGSTGSAAAWRDLAGCGVAVGPAETSSTSASRKPAGAGHCSPAASSSCVVGAAAGVIGFDMRFSPENPLPREYGANPGAGVTAFAERAPGARGDSDQPGRVEHPDHHEHRQRLDD